jgi:HK97 family phage major capsid protein
MSMQFFDLKKQRNHALDKADTILRAAETARRELTAAEQLDVDTCIAAANALEPKIRAIESKNTLRTQLTNGMVIPAVPGAEGRKQSNGVIQRLSADYAEQFLEYVQSNGRTIGASLSEGTNSAGGYAVPVVVDGQIVPLAPSESAVRQLATVIPTTSDIKLPRKGTFGVATAKAEAAAFTENDPTLEQFTLSAFMAGNMEKISWELAQDVPAFQAFCVDDGIAAQQMYEENKYINGSGTGEAQGLIGNVGAGTTQALSINGTLDLIGTLNAVYHPNASFLMQPATSIAIRKLQVGANLFEPVFTRVGTQDYLHGYPVYYSQFMPANTGVLTPILFGDFKRGYVIGDRGGSGISVRVLDQPFAVNGQIALLFYRRTDGRVRRSEAIQGYTL